jgi:DnaK suppressor protein
MTPFDPAQRLAQLTEEYLKRAEAIRRDLTSKRDADFAEQAQERQNEEVMEALLAEAEAELREVALARQRLADGHYGECQRCGEDIEGARLQALPATALCLRCAALKE